MNELTLFHTVKDQHPEVIRGFIDALEKTCLNEDEKLDVKIVHHHAHDLYAREMHLDEGSLVVGKIHKFENISVISKGEASVLTDRGVVRVKAPYTLLAPPGTKRVIFAHSDLVWTTFHATKQKDLEKIEDEIIAKSYAEVPIDWSFGKYAIKEKKK